MNNRSPSFVFFLSPVASQSYCYHTFAIFCYHLCFVIYLTACVSSKGRWSLALPVTIRTPSRVGLRSKLGRERLLGTYSTPNVGWLNKLFSINWEIFLLGLPTRSIALLWKEPLGVRYVREYVHHSAKWRCWTHNVDRVSKRTEIELKICKMNWNFAVLNRRRRTWGRT